MINIALFASGSGTNVENIVKYFKNSDKICIGAIFCNSNKALVINRAKELEVKCYVFNKIELNEPTGVARILEDLNIDYIVLAGFLSLIPAHIIKGYRDKILNIHPALMPKHCGHGMYGMKVHEAVVQAKDRKTGITIHKVNENYDEGAILFQAECAVEVNDTAEQVAEKVHALEYKFYPQVIEEYINNQKQQP